VPRLECALLCLRVVIVAESGLPPQFEASLTGYLRHLRSQRNMAEHTVRAYRTDLLNLFTHLDRLGIDSLDKVDLRALRSWLAKQHTVGHARTTLQRRAAAARVFFAWAHETGQVTTDPAANLRSPKTTRVLPPTLDRATAAQMMRRSLAREKPADQPPLEMLPSWRSCTPPASESQSYAVSTSMILIGNAG
jgi:site-specific recombinase XerC